MLSAEALFDRDSSLLVARGLYVLRYESGGGQFDHPTAVVRPGPGSEADIEIISAPGCPPGRLEQPGTALLVRAADNGRLQIGVKRRGLTGSLEAAFKLESVGGLSLGSKHDVNGQPLRTEDERTPLSPVTAAASADASSDALFVAHVARRGDVRVMPGEWAAGPETPAGIEGLEIRSFKEEGVHAELQVLPGSRDPKWSNWSGAGVFAGSRGKNRPLVGLRLRLAGEQAHRFIVNADALFLGSAIMNKRGREIECVSQAGRDPLVGFRFEVCPERGLSVRPAVTRPARDGGPRVRVFRAAAAA